MRKMGDKISSKQMAIEADVPIIPGVDHAVHGLEEVTKIAEPSWISCNVKGFKWWWRTWNAYRSFSRRDAKKNMQKQEMNPRKHLRRSDFR